MAYWTDEGAPCDACGEWTRRRCNCGQALCVDCGRQFAGSEPPMPHRDMLLGTCDATPPPRMPDADGESAYEVACPDPVHDGTSPVAAEDGVPCPDHRPVLDLAIGWYCPACGAEAAPDEAAPGPAGHGTTAYTDTSAPYVAHKPKEG